MMGVRRFDIHLAESFWARARGLIGRPPDFLAPGEVLCLAPCLSVHTWFMGRDIDVAFLDGSGRVVRSISGMPPWRFALCPTSAWVLERFSDGDGRWPAAGESVVLLACGAGGEDD